MRTRSTRSGMEAEEKDLHHPEVTGLVHLAQPASSRVRVWESSPSRAAMSSSSFPSEVIARS